MKVALIGGGGFRTPLSYTALLGIARGAGLSELVLHDVSAERLEHMQRVLHGLSLESDARLPFRGTTDLDDAIAGAEFVLCAIRVGGLEGRLIDETVPQREGVVGQETVGPGGIAFALRSIPALLEIARVVAQRAPRAWFINFTNPVGMTTEALQTVLGERAIGVCDTPSGLCRRVAGLLGCDVRDLWFDYFGLNHLGWLRGVSDGSGDRLPGLLGDSARLARLDEAALFGVSGLQALGMIPNEYLYYYGQSHPAAESRAAYLLKQQQAFYAPTSATTDASAAPADRPGPAHSALSAAEALAAWRRASAERDRTYMAAARAAPTVASADGSQPHTGGIESSGQASASAPGGDGSLGYADVAAALIDALARNSRTVLILNVANRGSLGFLDATAVVEVPCIVGSHGATPIATAEPAAHARQLIQRIKSVERLTIDAAQRGEARLAIEALARHPLVPGRETAERIFANFLRAQPMLAARYSSA